MQTRRQNVAVADNPRVAANRIRYMGNKHSLAPDVARVVATSPVGSPLIDVFAGMCSIAAAIAPSRRPVWSNDVQAYAALVADCQLCSQSQPLRSSSLAEILFSDFNSNIGELQSRFSDDLVAEKLAQEKGDPGTMRRLDESWPHIGNDASLAAEARELAQCPETFPYRLCAITFAHGYFGLRQALEIDSIRYAVARATSDGRLNQHQAQWAVFALLQAASVCAATPGHFAQYLTPKTSSAANRIRRQRSRSPWALFLDAADGQNPYGTKDWRGSNAVFRGDALDLWRDLDQYSLNHAVIYADPPYGKDQYSRYYHVLETLIKYDYPEAKGAGRYRPDRFTTPFSLKTEVVDAFRRLFESISDRGWTLVLSYPNSGLFHAASDVPLEDLMHMYFPTVKKASASRTRHSTLGARHGAANTDALEIIWSGSS